MVDKPTRITANSSTLLDVIITNSESMIIKSDVSPSPIADHETISIIVNIHKPKKVPEIRTYRCRKNYSQNTFCELLLNRCNVLNGILNTDDANLQVAIFSETFNECLDLCASLVAREITRPFAPWIGQELRETIKEKNMLQLKLKNDRSNQLLDSQLKQNKKDVEKLLNNAKKNHFKEKFSKCKGNSGGTWRVVGEMIPDLKGKRSQLFLMILLKRQMNLTNIFQKLVR